MFNIKLDEKAHKMSLKALHVKIQQSRNRQGAQCASFPPGGVRVNAVKENV